MSRAVRHALLAGFLFAAVASAQEFTETRFHRVHLKNGNFIDGALIRKDDREVVMQVKAGEMSIRVDLVDRVELVTIRTLNQPAKFEPAVKPAGPTKPKVLEAPVADSPRDSKEQPASVPRPPGMRKPEKLYVAEPAVRAKVDPLVTRMAAGGLAVAQGGAEELVKLGPDVAAYLASLLETVHPDVAVTLVEVLIRLKEPSALPVVGKLAISTSAVVREQAARIAGATAEPETSPLVLPLLKDAEPRVRAAGVVALREIGDREAFEHVATVLADPDRDVRARAVEAVTLLAKKHRMDKEVSRALRVALRDAQGAARVDLLLSLSQVREVGIWRDLAEHVSDSSPDIRAAAAEGLGRTGAKDAAGPVVAQMAREEDKKVRLALMGAAMKLTAVEAVPALASWLSDADADVRSTALRTLRVITRQSFIADSRPWMEWWDKNRPK